MHMHKHKLNLFNPMMIGNIFYVISYKIWHLKSMNSLKKGIKTLNNTNENSLF